MAACQLSIPLELKYQPRLIVGKILLLGCGPLKGNVRIEMAARTQFTMFLSILTNCFVNVRNLFVCACHYQGVLSFDSELTVQICDRLAVLVEGRLAYLGSLAALLHDPDTGRERSLEAALAPMYRS